MNVKYQKFEKSNFSSEPFLDEFKTNNFNLNVQQLSYLGLNQFVTGLENDSFKEKYQNILVGDPELFEQKVFNKSLSTASTALIQGTIDFLSEKMNVGVNLIINGRNSLSSTKYLNQYIDLKMKNSNDKHFFIDFEDDTPKDGYCFFHAVINLLDKSQFFPYWKDLIYEQTDHSEILKEEELQKLIKKHKNFL